MSTSVRFSVLIILLLLVGTGVAAMQSGATPKDRSVLVNARGQVVLDANGHRYTYPEQSPAERLGPAAAEALTAPLLDPWTGPQPSWSYSVFGTGIGVAGMIVAPGGPYPEIFVSAYPEHWYVLQYNPVSKQYEQTFNSPYLPGMTRIALANVLGDSTPELLVALSNGKVLIYDSKTKKYIKTLTTAAGSMYSFYGLDMAVADIDHDGVNEIVLSQTDYYMTSHLYVYTADGNLKWDLPNVGGILAVGQMDSDPALEIALSDGHVVDGATHTVQWFQPSGFNGIMTVADTDGDGIQELVTGGWDGVIAYDIAHQTTKWTFPIYYTASGVVRVADLDGDHIPELILGTGQWGGVYVYDIRTHALKWNVDTPDDGIDSITIADIDNDGKPEVVWSAGFYSSGADHLFVTDSRTQALKWQSVSLDGPFLGPIIGDLDGDGRNELVTASLESESGYGSARILVFDAASHKLRGISPPIMNDLAWGGRVDLKLRDVDRDGRLEIVVGADLLYEGAWEVYKFAADNTFHLSQSFHPWNNPLSSFTAIEASDLNNDGQTEIIASAYQPQVQVFSYNTGLPVWSVSLPLSTGSFNKMAIADLDGDGGKDIVGITLSGLYAVDSGARALKGQLAGSFTDFTVQNIPGSTYVWVSTPTGDLIKYRFTAGAFSEVSRYKPAATIDAFTLDGADRVWIASNNTLSHMTLSGTLLESFWGYGYVGGYGQPFAYHVEQASPSGFYTTGFFSVLGYGTAPVSAFNLCLQDDSSNNLLQINTTTGEYQFSNCVGVTIGGTGTVTQKGGSTTLQQNAGGYRVLAKVDGATKKATATIQVLSTGRTYSITDRDITNNTCACK